MKNKFNLTLEIDVFDEINLVDVVFSKVNVDKIEYQNNIVIVIVDNGYCGLGELCNSPNYNFRANIRVLSKKLDTSLMFVH